MKILKSILLVSLANLLALILLWNDLSIGAQAFNAWGPMREIEAKGREETKLVIYVAPGHTDADTELAISKHFKQKYGIDIEWTHGGSPDTVNRILVEQRARQYVADILMNGVFGDYSALKPRGYILPILAPSALESDIWRLDPATFTPTDRDWYMIAMFLRPDILINTNLVRPGEDPKSFRDLLQPKWKGKVVLQNPATPGSGSGWFQGTYRTLGLDYMRTLAKQVVLVSKPSDVPDSVARGQFAIGVSASIARARQLMQEGAPVRFIRPKEGSRVGGLGVQFIANAPHPNSAKVFFQWLYSREGQTLYSRSMQTSSLRKDVPDNYLPPEERFIEGEPFLMQSVEDLPTERVKWLFDQGREIFMELK